MLDVVDDLRRAVPADERRRVPRVGLRVEEPVDGDGDERRAAHEVERAVLLGVHQALEQADEHEAEDRHPAERPPRRGVVDGRARQARPEEDQDDGPAQPDVGVARHTDVEVPDARPLRVVDPEDVVHGVREDHELEGNPQPDQQSEELAHDVPLSRGSVSEAGCSQSHGTNYTTYTYNFNSQAPKRPPLGRSFSVRQFARKPGSVLAYHLSSYAVTSTIKRIY